MTQFALEGLRILDLTQVAVGPYATLLLGFMGAEVIKVESCSRMDISRGAARPTSQGEGLYPGGELVSVRGTAPPITCTAMATSAVSPWTWRRRVARLLQLATISDVLIENFRASVMDRLGLGYETSGARQPPTDLRQDQQPGGHGSGARLWLPGVNPGADSWPRLDLTGYEDGKPLMTNETYPDPVVGILAVGVLMAALRQRRQTGKGTFIDLSQREVTVAMLGEYVVDYSVTGRVPGPLGNRHPHLVPQGVYPCQGDDMWVAISVGSDDEWRGLCRAIAQPDLAQDPRFATVLARRHHQAELDQILTAWTQEREHYQAMHLLQAHGVPAGAVLKGGETLVDPHLTARGFWDVVNHPEAGTYTQVSTPGDSPRAPGVPLPPRLAWANITAMYSVTSWDSRSRRSRP